MCMCYASSIVYASGAVVRRFLLIFLLCFCVSRSAQPMFVPAARVAQLHTPLIPSRPAPINTQLGVQPTTSGSGTSSGPTSDTGSAPRVAATDDPLSAHINSAAAVSPQRTETMQDFRDPSSGGRSTIVAISHSSVHGSTIKTLDTLTSEFLAGSRYTAAA